MRGVAGDTRRSVTRVVPRHGRSASSMRTPPRTPGLDDLVRPDSSAAVAWWRGALIGAAALVLALGALGGLWLLARPLALLFAAISIAEALSPLVTRLELHLPRLVAVLAVYLTLLTALAGLGWVMVPRLVDQAQELAAGTPQLVQQLQSIVDGWDPDGSDHITAAIQRNVDRFSGALLGLPVTIVSSVVQLLLVLFMSAYWLLSAPALGRFFRRLFPPRLVPRVDQVLTEMRQSVGGYVRGEAIDALVVGAITYVGLLLIGLDYALVLALLAAIGELVPVVGPIVAAIPAVAVGLVDSPTQALVIAAFFLALQQFESNILVPHTMHQMADVPPLLAILAVFAGSSVGGLLGTLVAIPLAGALKVLVTAVVTPAVQQWAGRSGQEAAGDGRNG